MYSYDEPMFKYGPVKRLNTRNKKKYWLKLKVDVSYAEDRITWRTIYKFQKDA